MSKVVHKLNKLYWAYGDDKNTEFVSSCGFLEVGYSANKIQEDDSKVTCKKCLKILTPTGDKEK